MTNQRAKRTSASGDLILVGDEDDDRDLAQLEAGLAIDPRRARDALAAQAERFYRASLREARLRAMLDRDERQFTLTEARVLDDLRSGASRRDDAPPDALLVARSRVHADVEAARRAVSVSRRRLWLAESLRHAYEMRHAALIALIASK